MCEKVKMAAMTTAGKNYAIQLQPARMLGVGCHQRQWARTVWTEDVAA